MITKEEFDSLYDSNISRRVYNCIIADINIRFAEICHKFLIKTDKCRSWFDYANCSYTDENSNGFFDEIKYKEYIHIGGMGIKAPYGYTLAIPTRWLWEENWQSEMEETMLKNSKIEIQNKKLDNEKREEQKRQYEVLKNSIKAKLTREELKIVKFKM